MRTKSDCLSNILLSIQILRCFLEKFLYLAILLSIVFCILTTKINFSTIYAHMDPIDIGPPIFYFRLRHSFYKVHVLIKIQFLKYLTNILANNLNYYISFISLVL
jgi:hypothetical protein